jgi:hypothetical protein
MGEAGAKFSAQIVACTIDCQFALSTYSRFFSHSDGICPTPSVITTGKKNRYASP